MQSRCGLIKLKPGCTEQVKQWAKHINAHKQEAILSLVNESVAIESVFYTEINNQPYLIYYMKAYDFDKAQEVVKNSTLAIDDYHKKFKKDCWLNVKELENLIDLES